MNRTRNAIIFITFALLAAGGYLALMNFVSVVGPEAAEIESTEELPGTSANANLSSFTIGGAIPIEQGGRINVTRYDPQTGMARDRFRFATWTPIGDEKSKEVQVSEPELCMRIGNGMVLTVLAREGQIAVERPEQVQSNPKRGRLTGDVRILIDKSDADFGLIEADQPTPERVTIRLEELRFDLQVGTLSSDGALRVIGSEFDISGKGLFLEWSQADNQLKQLTLREGDQLVLRGGVGLGGFGLVEKGNAGAASKPAVAAAEPTRPKSAEAPRKPGVTYELVLSQNVRAEQRRGDRRVGGLDAGQVRILMDVGGSAGRFGGNENVGQGGAGAKSTSSAPATQSSVAPGIADSSAATAAATSTPAIAETSTASAPASTPASNPTSSPAKGEESLVVRWDGPLTLLPLGPSPAKGKARRQFYAEKGVVIEQGPSRIVCDRLEYFDQTKQIWLYAPKDGLVRMTRQNSAAVNARSVYVDQVANRIKLIGDVSLRSTGNGGRTGRNAISATHWAELQLRRNEAEPVAAPPPGSISSASVGDSSREPKSAAADATGESANAFELNRLESARFVGDVRVSLDGDRLDAGQLDVRFRSVAPAGAEMTDLIERAEAIGAVQFRGGDESLRCDRLELQFALAEARAYPAQFLASGAVEIQRGSSRIRGRHVQVWTEPIAADASAPPAAAPANAGPANAAAGAAVAAADASTSGVTIRRIEIVDRARLDDPDNLVSARGARIVADFVGRNELQSAKVIGTPERFAEVRADNYRVRGAQIDLDPKNERMSVNGRSWLGFDAGRALRGPIGRRGRVVEITSERNLRVDARSDRIEFSGNVEARSGDESLQSDSLNLVLRSVPQPMRQVVAPKPYFWGPAAAVEAVQQIRAALRAAPEGVAAAPQMTPPRQSTPASGAARLAAMIRPALGSGGGEGVRGLPQMRFEFAPTLKKVRKEPIRIIADNALFTSETLGPAGRQATTAEVRSPRLEFDIPERQLKSEGQTVLLLTSLNARATPDIEEESGGGASPLVSRGPSQTAIKCDQRMTYVIGRDEHAERRDSVVFEGAVRFFHRIGRELNLGQLMPDLQPAEIAKLPSRMTDLRCQRVEAEFVAEARAANDPRSADPRGGLRLAWFIATGQVDLRDEQDPIVRTVYCDRLEFNREQSLVTVTGSSGTPARIYLEDTEKNRLDQPLVGESLVVDLKTNKIRTQQARGEFRR